MPRQTLTQSIAAKRKADRAAQRAENALNARIAAAAIEIHRLEAQIAVKRSMLSTALQETGAQYSIDQLIERAGQKHISAALREHYVKSPVPPQLDTEMI